MFRLIHNNEIIEFNKTKLDSELLDTWSKIIDTINKDPSEYVDLYEDDELICSYNITMEEV